MISTVRQFSRPQQSGLLEPRLFRLPRATIAETSRPPRSVVQPGFSPFFSGFSLHWNIFPAGAVCVFTSHVSLHGVTEFSSNHAGQRGGKPIPISAEVRPILVRKIKNKNLRQQSFHFRTCLGQTRQRWEACRIHKISTADRVSVPTVMKYVPPSVGKASYFNITIVRSHTSSPPIRKCSPCIQLQQICSKNLTEPHRRYHNL